YMIEVGQATGLLVGRLAKKRPEDLPGYSLGGMGAPPTLSPGDRSGPGYLRQVIGIEEVRDAARRLKGVAHRTPLLTSRTLDHRVGVRALLKAEALQRTGSFKFRGAYNNIASIAPDQLKRGVLAFSSGNH